MLRKKYFGRSDIIIMIKARKRNEVLAQITLKCSQVFYVETWISDKHIFIGNTFSSDIGALK